MANCWRCGRTDRDGEIELVAAKRLDKHGYLQCEDKDDCDDHIDMYPEEPQDEVEGIVPWWAYR